MILQKKKKKESIAMPPKAAKFLRSREHATGDP